MAAPSPGAPATTPTTLTASTNGQAKKKQNVPSAKIYGQQSKLQNSDLINEFL